MGRVQAAVTSCGGGEHGLANGSHHCDRLDGTPDVFSGPFAGTPVGSRVESAVCTSRFARATFSFTYPFRL